jgi:hypothetical protein
MQNRNEGLHDAELCQAGARDPAVRRVVIGIGADAQADQPTSRVLPPADPG